MHGESDLLRGRLWNTVLRRRIPVWLAALLPLALLATSAIFRPAALAGLLLWAAWLVLDVVVWRRRVATRWAAWLDAAVPALEDSSALLACEPQSPIARLQQKRLQARLLSVLGEDDYRAIARSRAPFSIVPLLVSLAAAGAAWGVQHQQLAGPGAAVAAREVRPIIDGEVYLRVAPPAYTGVASFETAARDITVPQFSEVRWCVRNPHGAQPVVELSDGQTLTVPPECALWRAGESLFWRARGTGAKRYNVRVTPDLAPQITIVEPGEAVHVLAADAQSVQLSVTARDDYAVVRASLHMTLARGSGENIRFSDREVPLPQSADPRVRNWQKRWTLTELGMEPGDELYFFVRATDNAPGNPHTAQSPTYTLRLPGPAAESLEATALPSMVKPENLRSQRQIIIDTEQLVADMHGPRKLEPDVLRSRSEAIASDQATLRRRYGQFLGEESTLFGDEHEHEREDEHKGARGSAKPGSESSLIAEFGHAHDQEDNATIFDPKTKLVLKRALSAMWDAEKSLRAIDPKTALPPEYKALEAIKELQQAERVYLHRTAFVPPAMKEEKRLSGDIVGVLSYKRAQAAPGDMVAVELRDLVRALGQGSAAPLPALWSKTARDIIAAGIADQEQKLSAQRAVQDVQDGCTDCRNELRAWLRATVNDAPVLLQARPSTETPFNQAWRGKEQP